MRVPLLAWAPGFIQPKSVLEQVVMNVDIAPTFLELAGMDVPKNMQGQSFLPLLQGKSIPWRNKVFYEYYWEFDFPMTPTVFGVRSDKFKYIRYYGIWDTNELYDLEKDPDETTNLISKPEYAETAKKLAGELFDWLEQTGGMQIPFKRTIKNPYGDYRHPNQF